MDVGYWEIIPKPRLLTGIPASTRSQAPQPPLRPELCAQEPSSVPHTLDLSPLFKLITLHQTACLPSATNIPRLCLSHTLRGSGSSYLPDRPHVLACAQPTALSAIVIGGDVYVDCEGKRCECG